MASTPSPGVSSPEAASPSQAPAPDERLRVLTINIWNRSGAWEQRLPLLRRGLERLQPDLVAVQEVLKLDGAPTHQAEDLAAGLGYEVAYGAAVHVGGGLHLGNAALSRFPLSRIGRMQLPFHGEDETRGLLAVFAESPFGRIPFFVTHLNWKFHHGWIRERQVAFIADAIARLSPTSDPTLFPPILAGDFNAEPQSDEIRFLSGWHAIDGRSVYFADCFHVAGQGQGDTFVPSRNAYAALTHEPDRRIDYVFVRGPDRLVRGKPLAARVVFDEPEDGVWPSDHFGVLAELSTGARRTG